MVQKHDRYKTFVYEPSVSEGALIDKIQALGKSIKPDATSEVKRSVKLNSEQSYGSLAWMRTTKELEAALHHRPGDVITVKYSYDDARKLVGLKELRVSLKGTEALSALMTPDLETDSFQSRLVDEETGTEIPRSNVSNTTAKELLDSAGFVNSLPAKDQDVLSAALYSDMQIDEESIITHHRILHEAEFDGDYGTIVSRADIERKQAIEDGDILTSTVFTSTISTDTTTHARVMTVIDSEYGPTISVEEINIDEENDTSTRRIVELDYEELEKLLKQVDNASLSVDQ